MSGVQVLSGDGQSRAPTNLVFNGGKQGLHVKTITTSALLVTTKLAAIAMARFEDDRQVSPCWISTGLTTCAYGFGMHIDWDSGVLQGWWKFYGPDCSYEGFVKDGKRDRHWYCAHSPDNHKIQFHKNSNSIHHDQIFGWTEKTQPSLEASLEGHMHYLRDNGLHFDFPPSPEDNLFRQCSP